MLRRPHLLEVSPRLPSNITSVDVLELWQFQTLDGTNLGRIQTLEKLLCSTITIITTTITTIIALKGAIRDYLQSPHSAANYLQNVRSSGQGAVVCKSCATHRMLITCKCHVTCHVVLKDSSAIKFDKSSNHINFCFILLAGPLNPWTRGGSRSTRENLWRRASKNATY